MTTENIPQAAQVAGSLASLGESTRARAEAAAKEAAELSRRKQDILLGAATAVQVVEDEKAELDHEIDQLDIIRQRAAQLDDTPVVPPTPPAPVPTPVPTPAPVQKPDPAPAPDPVPPADDPAPVQDTPPADPGLGILDTPTSVEEPKKSTPVDRFYRLSGMWKIVTLAVAVFFALFGLWIAASWRLDNTLNESWAFAPINGLVTFVWFALWAALFFGIGGLLGLRVSHWFTGKSNDNT